MVSESPLFAIVTDIFEEFAKDAGLKVVARGIEKHGAWEWAAIQSDGFDRFATLDVVAEPAIGDLLPYAVEVWFGAEAGTRFVRRLSAAFRIGPWVRGPAPWDSARTELLARLREAWESASSLGTEDLVETRST